MSVFRANPLWKPREHKCYVPAFLVVNNKIYKTSNWHTALKLQMYSLWKTGISDRTQAEINNSLCFSILQEEGETWAKFSPEMYVRISKNGHTNYSMITGLMKTGCRIQFYVVEREKEEMDAVTKESIETKIRELQETQHFKNGSVRHFLARINGQILTEKEIFYLRKEKAFDNAVLLGDVPFNEKEEVLLREYMLDTLPSVISNQAPVAHDKLFALGMIRVAMKYYTNKTFWPYVEQEYGIAPTQAGQVQINKQIKEILKRYKKRYDDEVNSVVQNICMHCFICNKCAEQLFDYLFEFWRMDLSRSVENALCEDGSDLFDVLIEEIERNASRGVQDIMLHTTMALRQNPSGCKNRLRRLLRMIDSSYWNDTKYSDSANRLTRLFEDWKQKREGLFAKDRKQVMEGAGRKHGEKLLSSPTISIERGSGELSIILPRQILRNCTEEEHPLWRIQYGDKERIIEPDLLRGKASLFTEECRTVLEDEYLFSRIELTLYSDVRQYVKRSIPTDDLRFFNSRNRSVEATDDSITKDVSLALIKKGLELLPVSGSPFDVIQRETYDLVQLEPKEGDVFLLPGGHALAVGRSLKEGLIGSMMPSGVRAEFGGEQYTVLPETTSIFFKTSQKRCRGTSISIERFGDQQFWRKAEQLKLKEIRLDDQSDDVYGYLFDLEPYLKQDGIYTVTLDIPGLALRTYRICFMKDFSFEFENAPYFFTEIGTISFPEHVPVRMSRDWTILNGRKSLEFEFDESGRGNDDYVFQRKLKLPAEVDRYVFSLLFDLPVFYWKYHKEDEWVYVKPEDVPLKYLPDRIFFEGSLELRGIDLCVLNGDDLQNAVIPLHHDPKENLYYYRGEDIKAVLNRDYPYRYLGYRIGNRVFPFLNIICKSIVRSSSLTGDFVKSVIYGRFEIFGSGEYMVSIRYGNEIIEEDVPVLDGSFELNCAVKEGIYSVTLFELEEEEEFGFDSESIVLGQYELKLTDVRKMEGKALRILSLGNRDPRYGDLKINEGYFLSGLKHLDYSDEVRDRYAVYSWRHDFSDYETVGSFQYYLGQFCFMQSTGKIVRLGKALIIFDNAQNDGEALVNIILDGEAEPLFYGTEDQRLYTDETRLTKYERKRAKAVDDDLYSVRIEVI